MIKQFTVGIVIAVSGFTLGVWSVPEAKIELMSDGILNNAKVHNAHIDIFDAKRVNVSNNTIDFSKPWIKDNTYAIYAVGSEYVIVSDNLFTFQQSFLDDLKYKFIKKPEYPCAIVNNVEYKNCDDVPKEIRNNE